MMWSQAIVKGKLTRIGDGVWSGDTFKASAIEIGGQSLQGVRVAKCLLDCMETGMEMILRELGFGEQSNAVREKAIQNCLKERST